MDILKLANSPITGVQKVGQNFNSCPIKLRQVAQDVFMKSQSDGVREYLEHYQKNPNTAFIYNPKLSHQEKMSLVRQSSKVFKSQELSTMTGFPSTAWLKDKFFDIETYIPKQQCTRHKTHSVKILDTTTPTNKKALETLQRVAKGAVDGETFRQDSKMDVDTYLRYCREGLIERVQLPNKITGNPAYTNLIIPTTEKNQRAIERFQALMPKDSELAKKSVLDATELSKLGFGTPKEIAQLVKGGQIDGHIKVLGKNAKGQTIVQAQVDITSPKTRLFLKDLKSRDCIEVQELSKRTGISIRDFEEAILSGEFEPVKRLFPYDSKYPMIDTKNPKNAETFSRMMFQKRLEDEACQEAKAASRAARSLTNEIAWHLSPQTRAAGSIGFAKSDTKRINQEIKKVKEFLSSPALDPKEQEALEDELIRLNLQKEIEAKKAFSYMWKTAGTEEYKAAYDKAKKIMAQYKAQGIESIEDSAIRNIILGFVA